MTGTGRGKVILVGEHAVVHGAPALAGALRLGARAVRGPGDGALRLGAVRVHPDPAGDRAARAWAALRGAAGLPPRGGDDVIVELDLPIGAGLGGSAAVAVAVARALVGDDRQRVAQAAAAFEEVAHGRASGLDAHLAQHGGLGVYRRGAGFRAVAGPPLRLAIGLSGEPRSTADAVDAVARRRAADAAWVEAQLDELGALALRAAEHLAARRMATLGRDLDAAQAVLSGLGVSSPGLDALCRIARRAGALGAKLTGAGRGGAAMALAPGWEDAIVRAWREAGFDGFVADVGEGGA